MAGGPESADAVSGIVRIELLGLWYGGDIVGGIFDIYGFCVLGWRWEGVEKGRVVFDDAEPGFVVGREYFHGFAGSCGNGSWFDDNLVVIQVELHGLLAELFKDFGISTQFIDFVFEIREDVGCVVGFYEIDNVGDDIFPRFCGHENKRDIEFFELFLHQAQSLDNEIASCGTGAVPLEFCGTIDVYADKRGGLLLG